MKTVHVTASKNYDVLIESGHLSSCGERIRAATGANRVCLVSDDTVFSLYGAAVMESLTAAGLEPTHFVFPHGEASKNTATYLQLLSILAEQKLSRRDALVALGGGVVGDLTGFAAATYLRGVPFVQLPTTLLACVDSSVGGKTAVDLPQGKNLVGAFWQPSLVLCDTDALSTLPDAIFSDGMAEVIKYAVLQNEDFFTFLASHPARQELETVIETCVKMKRDIVAADEFDRGCRQTLNLGHTFGHAVEASSSFTVSHGSAVAIGMAMITRAAVKRGLCEEATLEKLLSLLVAYQLPTETEESVSDLLPLCTSDKKVAGASVNLIVPRAIGKCEIMPTSLSDLPAWLKDGGAK